MGIIYSIVNKINCATYIGSTNGNVKYRWQRHRTDLNHNRHHSIFLQRAWNKYGKNNFKFIILKEVDNLELLNEEQKFLDDRRNNFPSNLNYNICWNARNCEGRNVSEKTKEKLRIANKGKIVSDETKIKISEGWERNSKKTYKLISPTNEITEFKNIRKFSRENGLTHTAIKLLLENKIYQHKGWVKNYSHTYSFISPDSIIYENIVNLTEFCKKHDLKMKGMSKLHCGKAKSYFKWKKYNNNENK